MSKKKQNSARDRPLRKGIKRPAQKRGPAGLSHYGRNYKPTRQATKKKNKGRPKKYKAHHHTKPSF